MRNPSVGIVQFTLRLSSFHFIPFRGSLAYDQLIAKRQTENLTPDEYSQLLSLSDRIETLEANRIESIAELARLRQTSLTTLMAQLGIQPPADE